MQQKKHLGGKIVCNKRERGDEVVVAEREREDGREGAGEEQAPSDGLHVQFLTLDVVTLACDGAEIDKRRERQR